MLPCRMALSLAFLLTVACVGGGSKTATGADPQLASFIARIRAVDNHSQAATVVPGDTDAATLAGS